MRVNLEKNAHLLSRIIVAMLLLITCFVVAVAVPASSLALQTTPISPTAVGISVKLAATATGFSSPEYMFKAKYTSSGGTVWQTLRAYSPTTYYYWTPTEAHDYTVIAYTREVGSVDPYTLYREYSLKVNPAVSSINVFYSPISPVETDVPITFSPTAVGGGTMEYSYKAKYLSGGNYVWQTLRGMSPVSDFTWTPTEAHHYIVYIYAREAGSVPNQTYSIFKEIPIVVDGPSGPGTVDLGTAGNYAILAETKITTTGVTSIVGDIAISPAALTYMTGFSETLHGTYATSPIVTGQMFAANMTEPTPSNLTTAIGDMGIAYTDAAGRTNPNHSELGSGDISGMTLAPGLYKWSSGVLINTDVTLAGGPKSTWIFQIAGDLTLATGAAIVLSGGAQPENIVWQVAGQVTMEASTSFKGIILSMTQIVMKNGAVLNGRALAQTAVTMIGNYVVEPSANQPLSWLQLKTSPISPTAVGVPVKLTAIATGGKLMEYMFKVKYTGPSGSVWQTVQEYSTSAVCTWRPAGAHVYTIVAYVRELGLTTWVPYSLYREQIITVNPAVTDLKVKVTPISPSVINDPVTFSITPVGGGTMEYRMRVKYWDGAAFVWSATPAFSKLSKIVWTPTVARDYTVYIYGREVGMDVTYSLYKEIPYTVLTTAHAGPLGLELGTGSDYTILTNTGIVNAGPTLIQGNIGTTPALQSSIIGFSETLDVSNSFAKSVLVTGKIFAAGMAAPTPAKLTAANNEMIAALDDAAGRTSPDFTDVGSGIIGNTILLPGLYNWTTGVAITDDITLDGGQYDIWIFQINGTLDLASAKKINLTGGAQAKNIFWQVTGTTTLATTSNFQGIILAKQQIVLQDGATLTGRAYSQHGAISLNASTVNQP